MQHNKLCLLVDIYSMCVKFNMYTHVFVCALAHEGVFYSQCIMESAFSLLRLVKQPLSPWMQQTPHLMQMTVI